VLRLQEIGGDGTPHVAQTDESDVHDLMTCRLEEITRKLRTLRSVRYINVVHATRFHRFSGMNSHTGSAPV
jgi:hypothetical protein